MGRPGPRRGTSDRVFGFTLTAIGVVLDIVLFVVLWLLATLILFFVSAIAGITNPWFAVALGALVSAFAVWFLHKVVNVGFDGIVAAFGNEPSREAVIAEHHAARDPAQIIVEDEVAGQDANDLESRLRTLARLRDQGLITPEDYEAQKQRLLESG